MDYEIVTEVLDSAYFKYFRVRKKDKFDINEEYLKDFKKRINDLLNKEYIPSGGISITAKGEDIFLAQALIKK